MKKSVGLVVMLLLTAAVVSADSLTIRPDSQGARKGWGNVGCSSGVNEWQCVDEVVADTSDYLRTSGTRKETFLFSDTGLTTEDINSVTLYYYATEHNHAGNSCFQAMTRSGSTEYFTGVQMCAGASWGYVSHTYTTNPASGSAWTVSEVDALEAGMRGLNPNGGGRVAQVYAVIDYDPINDTNETNETSPDLTIDDITGIPFWELVNGTNESFVNVSVTVKNIGDATAGASTTRLNVGAGVYDYSTPSLSAGASHVINDVFDCPLSTYVTINATADVFDDVAESDELNNYDDHSVWCGS